MKDGVEQFQDWLASARFFWLCVIYATVMLFVWRFAWPDQPISHDYRAAVTMAHNHRVVASDLRRPDGLVGSLGFYMKPTASIEGTYVKPEQGISAGMPVNPAVLADRPDMTLPAQTSAVVYPSADAKLIALLDVGSPVMLFGPDADPKAIAAPIPAIVHAILCDPAGSDAKACYPVLWIAESQAPLVLKNLPALKLAPAPVPSPQKPQ
jgi:hypothetical protein